MNLRHLALAVGTALQVHTIIKARRNLAQALEVDGDPDQDCGRWCSCRLTLDDICGDSPDDCDDGLAIICGLDVGHTSDHLDIDNSVRWRRRYGLGAA